MKLLKYIFWGILLLYFQILFAANFAILGIIPNFFIAFIIYINLNINLKITLPVAFLFGLALDLFNPLLLGLNAFTFIWIALLTSHFHKSINKKRFVVVFFSILFLNILYYFINFVIQFIFLEVNLNLFLVTICTIIYSTAITILTIYLFLILDKLKLYIDV